MRDLIDRQEIIDRLDLVIEKGLVNILSGEHPITAEVMKEVIEDLPSAEPESKQYEKGLLEGYAKAKSEIIRCKDCKYHRYEGPIPCCTKIDYGYGWTDDDFCSQAERRTDE